MLTLLRWILTSQRKRSKITCKTSGFTLLELLVAMILAVLVITPLLTFVVSIMDNDRKEQAKANAEQDIKSAIDYIAQDLEQAVYIYDADGLNGDPSATPKNPIINQIPPVSAASNDECSSANSSKITCVPVLVFWKRQLIKNAAKFDGNNCDSSSLNQKLCNDSFVYSLVAYYLVQGNTSSSTWSKAARIARFEVKGGVLDTTQPQASGKPVYLTTQQPDAGFQPFSLNLSGNIKQKLDQWVKDPNTAYTVQTQVLTDYIDQNLNVADPTSPDPAACTTTEQRVPKANSTTPNSFYACVNSTPGQNYARVYIRGNALARISSVNIGNQSSYFPKTSILVKGRGFLSQ